MTIERNHATVLLGLLPPVSYARNAPNIRQQAHIDGKVLDGILNQSLNVLNATFPYTSKEALSDWERVLGLTPQGENYQQRLASVLVKINAIGGLSIPYFIELARHIGYEINIEEPQPFRAGQNRAGDVLAIEDIIFIWNVHIRGGNQKIWRFRASQSSAGERISSYSDMVIESIFKELKPAHTWVNFYYSQAKNRSDT